MQKSKESCFREVCWAKLLEKGRNRGRKRYNHKIRVKRSAFCVFQGDFIAFMRDLREGRNCVFSTMLERLGLIVTCKFPPLHKTWKLVRGTVQPAALVSACMYCKSPEKRALYSCSAGPAPLPSCFHSPRSFLDKQKLTIFAPEDNSGGPRAGEACQVEAGQRVRQSIWRSKRRVFVSPSA